MSTGSPDRKRRRRASWRCPSCDVLVPREQEQCACGFLKEWRNATARSGLSYLHAALAATVVLGALLTLWLLLA